MSYTNDQLTTMVDALTARLAVLDGVGLAPSAPAAAVPALTAKVNGLKKDLSSVTVALEQKLFDVKNSLTSLLATVKTLAGIS